MTDKHQVTYYLPTATSEVIKDQAKELGVSTNALADLFLRFAQDRLGKEALRKWASSLPSTKGCLGGALTKVERNVLGAFDVLSRQSEWGKEVYCFSVPELAAKASVLPKEAYAAVQSLARRGLVDGIESFEADRHGRPTESFWWPAGRFETHPRFPAQHPGNELTIRGWPVYVRCWELTESWVRGGRDKALLYQRVVELRRQTAGQLMDPAVVDQVERDARLAFGISARALALKPRIVDPSASPAGASAGG